MLAGDGYADAVRADEAEARALGISGVPFFVVDRKYGVSGAQPADQLLAVLERAWSERSPLDAGGQPVPGGRRARGVRPRRLRALTRRSRVRDCRWVLPPSTPRVT